MVFDKPRFGLIVRFRLTIIAFITTFLNTPYGSVQLYSISANATSAFKMLAASCRSECMVEECFAALAIVLMLPEHTEIRLAEMKTPPMSGGGADNQNDCYTALFSNLDSCITLSCSSRGIESLLCSQFFEPSVPCNLVGPHILGIRRAIEAIQSDNRFLTALMITRNPALSPLWHAANWSGYWPKVLRSALGALGALPPLNLAVASWTGTVQSFLQVDYDSLTNKSDYLARACEFSYTYMIIPDLNVPLTSSPPFGEVALDKTNLDIRAHLPHHHEPRWHRTYWILDQGDELLAQTSKLAQRPVVRLSLETHVTRSDTITLE